MAYTIDVENDVIGITEPLAKSDLDRIAKQNGLSKDYLVDPIQDSELQGNGNFYYTVNMESGYWVHDVAN